MRRSLSEDPLFSCGSQKTRSRMESPGPEALITTLAAGGPEAERWLSQIPPELLADIVSRLSPKEILRLCQTSMYFNATLCQTDNFGLWRRLYQRDIASIPDTRGGPPINYAAEYRRVMNTVAAAESKEVFNYLIANGYDRLLASILDTYGRKPPLYEKIMILAAKLGSLPIVQQMDARGASEFKQVVEAAAKNGHRDIVEYALKRTNQLGLFYGVHDAITNAIRAGHPEIVGILIDWDIAKGFPVDLNLLLSLAGTAGQLPIINSLLDRGANSLGLALAAAALNGHLDIVKRLVTYGVPRNFLAPNDLQRARTFATNYSHPEIVAYLDSLGST